jgi:hypothetical protein
MSFGNGEGSHSEMGRENSMTCRAKTYGNSFTEEGQKEKMEGSGTLGTARDQEPLECGCTPPEECVNPPRGKTYGDSFTGEEQGENTEGVVTLRDSLFRSRELLLRLLPSIFVIGKEPPSFTLRLPLKDHLLT